MVQSSVSFRYIQQREREKSSEFQTEREEGMKMRYCLQVEVRFLLKS